MRPGDGGGGGGGTELGVGLGPEKVGKATVSGDRLLRRLK